MIKKIFLFTCLVIVSSYVRAQISVVSFRYLEHDNDANTFGQIMKDQNGDKAALIKVVTPIKDLTFDLGQMEQVAYIPKSGEIWLYIQRRSTKISIISPKFGKLTDYKFNMPIDGGRTYEMLLDVGTGRFVTITTAPRTNSDVTIDGEYIGKSPIYNRYLNFGPHTIFAKNDRWEGTDTIEVLPKDSKTDNYHPVKMRDMSDHYGEVTVNVEKDADIYFENQLVGTGTWKTELREGKYYVETKKADCDSARTYFTVVAKKENVIKVNAPTPHTGWLSIYTRPGNVKTTYNGNHFIDLSENVSVPIGTYQMEFSRKGYITEKREYLVKHNETAIDTVTLQPINYIKPTAFYFGLAFTYSTLAGISGIAGVTIKNHDLQLSYTFGLAESKQSYWNDSNNQFLGACKHKINSLSIKYGYQIPLLNKMAITPQLGYSLNTLSSIAVGNSDKYADGAKADLLTVGAKATYVPFHHCYLFLAPEVDIVLKKDNKYNSAAEKAGFTKGGFVLHAGVLVNF